MIPARGGDRLLLRPTHTTSTKWYKVQFARYKNPFCSPASLSSSPVSSPQVARSSQRAARGRTRRGSGSAQTLVVEVEVEVVLMVEMVDGGGG